ncbi:transcription factor Sox-21-B-like [Melanotaenia boesemani]|uniref:transcription factor Sox-21-B-like n=1 Tax=Melanotaenia boesemani TaxID=1250792 RepID=UPI001C0575E1|nr:transcription factor Sox-21-B-like [Melanotaenia boesemani]
MDRELQIKLERVQVDDVPKYYLPRTQNVPKVDEHFQTVDEAHVRRLNGTEHVCKTDNKIKTTWSEVEEFPTSKNACSESDSEGHHVVEVPLKDDVAEEHGKPREMHLQSSNSQRGQDPIINFTTPPTEEDIKLLQSVQDKNGHIKRPKNAFFVWTQIHRNALKQAYSLTNSQDINTLLAYVWSKLTDEQKRPYFETAHKLRVLHEQQFPDYQYHPKKRKCNSQQLTTEQRARLAEGQQQALSIPWYFVQAMPLAHPSFPDVCMNACPVLMPHIMCNHPISSFPHHQIDYFSRFQIHSPRLFYTSTIHQELHWGTEYPSLHSPAGGSISSGSLQQETMQLRHSPVWSPLTPQ